MNGHEIEQFLKLHNIKPSLHRIKIFDYLVNRKNHPTADMIYHELIKEIPTLSKTTVYNTLNLFVKKKTALLITIEDHEARYDADTSIHGHFKCSRCRQIYDIRLNMAAIQLEELDNFQIDENHIYFKGICPNCLKAKI